MKMFARFDEIQTMILQDIIEVAKGYGQTNRRMHTQKDNMKTVYPLSSDVETVLPSHWYIYWTAKEMHIWYSVQIGVKILI